MIKYGEQELIDRYFKFNAVSQSFLKALLKGVEFTREDEQKLFYEEKGSFIIGNAVDMILTQGKQAYDENFVESTVKKPSDTIKSIVNMVFEQAHDEGNPPMENLETYGELLERAVGYHGYQSRWNMDTRKKKIIEQGEEYFKELQKSVGKIVLSKTETLVINNIVMSMTTSKYTSKWFTMEHYVDIYYQVPIYFVHKGVKCKALIDMLRVDRKNKTISPIDIKTTAEKVKNFPKVVWRMGYHIQAAFYMKALSTLIKSYPALSGPVFCPIDLGNLKGFVIENFRFITETTDYSVHPRTGEVNGYQGNPLTFKVSADLQHIGQFGRPTCEVQGISGTEQYPISFKEIDGFEKALELYQWHENNNYEEDRTVIESEGEILLKP